jgi:flagellar basal-body rod modification protein FlgD
MADAFDTTLGNLGIARAASGTAVQGAGTSNTTLGQADFLKLMTAQMRNQDPFDPVDNTQMVAQMAQFSSLAGITEMSSTLKAIAAKLGAASVSDATAYVGRTVLTEGATAYPLASGGLTGAVELDAATTATTVTISDASGAVLKTVDLGPQTAGTVGYAWDGTTDSGEPAGDGPYTIRVAARDGTATVAARPLVWAPVTSVSLPASGDPVLNVAGLGTVPLSAVRQVG